MWHSYVEGKKYFIQTATHYFVGRLVKITETDLLLDMAAWIPDTGRYSEFMASGVPAECEPLPPEMPLIVIRSLVVAAAEVEWRLPMERK